MESWQEPSNLFHTHTHTHTHICVCVYIYMYIATFQGELRLLKAANTRMVITDDLLTINAIRTASSDCQFSEVHKITEGSNFISSVTINYNYIAPESWNICVPSPGTKSV
jgi:hypothetical protein